MRRKKTATRRDPNARTRRAVQAALASGHYPGLTTPAVLANPDLTYAVLRHHELRGEYDSWRGMVADPAAHPEDQASAEHEAALLRPRLRRLRRFIKEQTNDN